MAQARCWCFTMYNYDIMKLQEMIENNQDKYKYCVFQQERCPKTRKKHVQGYIVFNRGKRLGEVKKFLNDNTVHLETARGTPDENRKYCTKTESRRKNTDYIEYGNIKMCGQGRRNDIEGVRDLILEENYSKKEILGEAPGILAKYPKFVDYCLEVANEPTEKTREAPEVIYIHGKPGVGKTKKAVEMTEDKNYYELVDDEKAWFCGYKYEKVVLIDDFTGKLPRNKILKLLDRYPFSKRFEIKGGHVWCDPDLIIITSNYEIDDLEYDSTTKTALKRRITKTIKM